MTFCQSCTIFDQNLPNTYDIEGCVQSSCHVHTCLNFMLVTKWKDILCTLNLDFNSTSQGFHIFCLSVLLKNFNMNFCLYQHAALLNSKKTGCSVLSLNSLFALRWRPPTKHVIVYEEFIFNSFVFAPVFSCHFCFNNQQSKT